MVLQTLVYYGKLDLSIKLIKPTGIDIPRSAPALFESLNTARVAAHNRSNIQAVDSLRSLKTSLGL